MLKVGGDAWDRPVGERILESGNKGLRREDAQISGTKVLQNLKLVVLSKVLQNLKLVVLKYCKLCQSVTQRIMGAGACGSCVQADAY